MRAYQPDLAYIHDAGFGEFSRKAAPGILRILRRAGIHEGRVLDLGCGSGLWARELVKAGYGVWGIDISPAMIQLARRRAPTGSFRAGSFLSAKLPSCRAVTALGEVVNYLFDEGNSPKGLSRTIDRIYRCLEPGGVLIFDVAQPGRGAGPKWNAHEGKDWLLCREASEDTRSAILTRKITTFRKAGTLYRRSREVHRLRLYREKEVAAILGRAGFGVRILHGYGRLRFPKAHVGFLASKP